MLDFGGLQHFHCTGTYCNLLENGVINGANHGEDIQRSIR